MVDKMPEIKIQVEGFLKIFDPVSNEVFFEGNNSIHFENLSVAIAECLGGGPLNPSNPGFIYTMNFGNGGTTVNASGIVTYNPPNVVGATAQLYNQTYSLIVNNQFAANLDPINDNITYNHIPGKAYTDVVIVARLDYGQPADQLSFDNSNDLDSSYAFDELGLFSYNGQLLTHVIFSPILKSLNRLIDIAYTLRISTLSSLSV
jgi:hypothetical protein